MRYYTYKVRYEKTGEIFTQEFTEDQHPAAKCGLPEDVALSLVNMWNRQNATSGFTYWIDEGR